MDVRVEVPRSKRELSSFRATERYTPPPRALAAFVQFDSPCSGRRARTWSAARSAVRGALARGGRRRMMAVSDDRYVRHWNEPLGHAVMFEAMPGRVSATQHWSRRFRVARRARATAVRGGSHARPAVRDRRYESLPPTILRRNRPTITPSQEAASMTRGGWSIPERVREADRRLAAAVALGGATVRATRSRSRPRREPDLAATWTRLRDHWGHTTTPRLVPLLTTR